MAHADNIVVKVDVTPERAKELVEENIHLKNSLEAVRAQEGGKVGAMLRNKVNASLESFLRGESHRYEIDRVRVRKDFGESPNVIMLDPVLGGYIKLTVPRWLHEKILSICEKGGDYEKSSWGIIDRPEKPDEK